MSCNYVLKLLRVTVLSNEETRHSVCLFDFWWMQIDGSDKLKPYFLPYLVCGNTLISNMELISPSGFFESKSQCLTAVLYQSREETLWS